MPIESVAERAVLQSQCRACPFVSVDACRVSVTPWRSGLAEYDEMEDIAWNRQSIDGSMHKAPLAQEAVGLYWPSLSLKYIRDIAADIEMSDFGYLRTGTERHP